jgi:hypothetical protein
MANNLNHYRENIFCKNYFLFFLFFFTFHLLLINYYIHFYSSFVQIINYNSVNLYLYSYIVKIKIRKKWILVTI